MARLINWNVEPFLQECVAGGMARLVLAAEAIRDDMKRTLQGRMGTRTIYRVPGRRYMIVGGKRVSTTDAPVWMEREPGAMVRTIRVVRRHDSGARNVWIMAGNYKTWWATQLEYGRGGWKGGAKPFMRPALQRAPMLVRKIIEEGGGIGIALESGRGETR